MKLIDDGDLNNVRSYYFKYLSFRLNNLVISYILD